MCGITGYCVSAGDPRDWASNLSFATDSMRQRGPDDSGQWFSEDRRVGLGHRRLAILDLSAHGHQPMLSACGQWVMVFNGEVYNFHEIRAELEQLGHRFAGTGDSEVILAAIAQWGPLRAVTRFIGMFAIALWHRATRQLHLLRDRLGVKPLYYYWNGRVFAFGSELKALRAFRTWSPEIDPDALTDYLRYGYIVEPRSIYRDVRKLPPAHHLVLDETGGVTLTRYWSALDHAGRRNNRGAADLSDELEALMISAFRYRMIADVPVGVFLSGGVDSSVLTALLQAHGGSSVKTFTIGFDVPDYDESTYANQVAQHLKTEHCCRILRISDAKAILPRWGDLFDEPFGDESGIPTLLVSQVAAERVKVVLSADGGDELFAGYTNYVSALRQWSRLSRLPLPARRGLARTLQAVGVSQLDDWLAGRRWPGQLNGLLRGKLTTPLEKVSERAAACGVGEVFDAICRHFRDDELAMLTGNAAPTRSGADGYPGSAGEQLCLWDLHNYLPGDVLTKVDRATMSASIEGREPLIDHRIAEFAVSIPFGLRQGPLGPKHLLRTVLYRYVPRPLVDRPKRGFAVPVKEWLVTDLQELVREHLSERTVVNQGLFEPELVQRFLGRLWAGDKSVRQRVWLLLAFQMWHQRWMAGGQ